MKKIYLKIKHWLCKVGLCNLDKCKCDCHEDAPKYKYYHQTLSPEDIAPPTGAIEEEATTGLANPLTEGEEIEIEAKKIKAEKGGTMKNARKKARKNLGIDT